MSDIITIPAGVIQPKDLLMWLRKRRDEASATTDRYEQQDDADEYVTGMWRGREQALNEVIQHISFGGAS